MWATLLRAGATICLAALAAVAAAGSASITILAPPNTRITFTTFSSDTCSAAAISCAV